MRRAVSARHHFSTNLKDFMKNLYNGIRKFVQDEEGATAVEYGMIVGLIAVAIIAFVGEIGVTLAGMFEDISTCLTTPATC